MVRVVLLVLFTALTNMKSIKGLFVVENDSVGFFAYLYPELTLGVAAEKFMTFGRQVGKYLADL